MVGFWFVVVSKVVHGVAATTGISISIEGLDVPIGIVSDVADIVISFGDDERGFYYFCGEYTACFGMELRF